MPTVNDATVVASAYDTSGNGGRKLIRLSNGWLIAGEKNGVNIAIQKSVDNGVTWVSLTSMNPNTAIVTYDFSLIASGTDVYAILSVAASGSVFRLEYWKFSALSVASSITQTVYPDASQTAMGNCSLAINGAGTELHATWSSKNSSYASCFNIRYAKGMINADKTVTWGAIEQVTSSNTSGQDISNPSIVINSNGTPFILHNISASTAYQIVITAPISTSSLTNGGGSYSTAWGYKTIYNGSTYSQSNPSAVFIPQSINGLANGRIWVSWHGNDATYTNTSLPMLRHSYSDDGGATWSAMQIISAGTSYSLPSFTFSKDGRVFLVAQYNNATVGSGGIRYTEWSGTAFGAIQTLTVDGASSGSSGGLSPSTLLDPTFKYSVPLVIYKGASKVGFYGAWTVLTISVTQGSIGTKTNADISNFLTYTITTDGTMSTITEKLNGTTIGTKTATSGQSQIAGLTQAQWDAIKFGKYADATGGANTLTVSMGSDTWTYTFDKRLATDADVLIAVKAVQDSQNTYLPGVKAKLASSVRGKGGTVNDTDSFDVIKTAIDNMSVKRYAKGSKTSDGSYMVVVTGLSFTPKTVIATADSPYTDLGIYVKDGANGVYSGSKGGTLSDQSASNTVGVGQFSVKVPNASVSYNWIAFE